MCGDYSDYIGLTLKQKSRSSKACREGDDCTYRRHTVMNLSMPSFCGVHQRHEFTVTCQIARDIGSSHRLQLGASQHGFSRCNVEYRPLLQKDSLLSRVPHSAG